MAQAHSLISQRGTYVYRFGFRSTALHGQLGAAHTVELPFVFDIADSEWLHGQTGLLGPDPVPQDLGAEMHRAWIALAHSGSPGWFVYDHSDDSVRRFA
jgi:para-nitrobenzyl esterase